MAKNFKIDGSLETTGNLVTQGKEVATREWVEGVIAGKVDYLGIFNSSADLISPIAMSATAGDYARCGTAFEIGKVTAAGMEYEQVHVGDLIVKHGAGNSNSASNWDIIHTEDPGNYVTLDTDQTISGNKTFSSNVQFGSQDIDATTPPVVVNSTYGYIALGEVDLDSYATKLTFSERGANVDYFGKYIKYPYYNYTLNLPEPKSSETHTLATQEWVNEQDFGSNVNIENGEGDYSLQQKSGKTSATGEGAVALNGGYKIKEDGTETAGVQAFGKWSIAGGKDTETYQRCSTAIGGGNKAGLTPEEFAEKYPNGTDPHGKTYEESYSFATAEGVDNKATGYGAHAENERNIASGKNSHASGQETEATGDMAFSTGYKTYATAPKSFTMGDNTHADGIGSFAQGYGGKAKGNWSTVLGESCEATKDGAVAGGTYSKANGKYSLAFGGKGISAENNPTKADNEYAIALGRGAQATGLYQSTAIGLDVTASGNASLAMGWNSKATELSSVAIGQDCESNGTRSMTVGWGNKTNIPNQFVCGTYCKENTRDALFVVGNGGGGNLRSNAFEVYENGSVKAGCQTTSTDDSLVLVTKGYVDALEARIAALEEKLSTTVNSHFFNSLYHINKEIK